MRVKVKKIKTFECSLELWEFSNSKHKITDQYIVQYNKGNYFRNGLEVVAV